MAAFFLSLICFPSSKLKESSADNRKRRTLLIRSHALFCRNPPSWLSWIWCNEWSRFVDQLHFGSFWSNHLPNNDFESCLATTVLPDFTKKRHFPWIFLFLVLQRDKGKHPGAVASAILCQRIKQKTCDRIRQCDCRSRKKHPSYQYFIGCHYCFGSFVIPASIFVSSM